MVFLYIYSKTLRKKLWNLLSQHSFNLLIINGTKNMKDVYDKLQSTEWRHWMVICVKGWDNPRLSLKPWCMDKAHISSLKPEICLTEPIMAWARTQGVGRGYSFRSWEWNSSNHTQSWLLVPRPLCEWSTIFLRYSVFPLCHISLLTSSHCLIPAEFIWFPPGNNVLDVVLLKELAWHKT